MRPIPFLADCSRRSTAGYTMVEVMVALTITAVLMTLVASGVRFQSDTMISEMGRIRIQQNLRSALDILSINIRQAGEGFDELFPAVLLSQQGSPQSSVLTLRRKVVHDVLTVCKANGTAEPKLYISDDEAEDAKCLPVNVAEAIGNWGEARSDAGGTLRIYAWDRVNLQGEFLDVIAEGAEQGDDYLRFQHLSTQYPPDSTSLYVIEEYQFALNAETDTLKLQIDGYSDQLEDVAYNVTAFNAGLRLLDDSEIDQLDPSNSQTWKDLRSILIELEGEERWRTTTMRRSVRSEFMPRNIISN